MEQRPYAISDASRAIQSMMLTAWAEGVGSNWVGFRGLNAAKPLLAIPNELDVLQRSRTTNVLGNPLREGDVS